MASVAPNLEVTIVSSGIIDVSARSSDGSSSPQPECTGRETKDMDLYFRKASQEDSLTSSLDDVKIVTISDEKGLRFSDMYELSPSGHASKARMKILTKSAQTINSCSSEAMQRVEESDKPRGTEPMTHSVKISGNSRDTRLYEPRRQPKSPKTVLDGLELVQTQKKNDCKKVNGSADSASKKRSLSRVGNDNVQRSIQRSVAPLPEARKSHSKALSDSSVFLADAIAIAANVTSVKPSVIEDSQPTASAVLSINEEASKDANIGDGNIDFRTVSPAKPLSKYQQTKSKREPIRNGEGTLKSVSKNAPKSALTTKVAGNVYDIPISQECVISEALPKLRRNGTKNRSATKKEPKGKLSNSSKLPPGGRKDRVTKSQIGAEEIFSVAEQCGHTIDRKDYRIADTSAIVTMDASKVLSTAVTLGVEHLSEENKHTHGELENRKELSTDDLDLASEQQAAQPPNLVMKQNLQALKSNNGSRYLAQSTCRRKKVPKRANEEFVGPPVVPSEVVDLTISPNSAIAVVDGPLAAPERDQLNDLGYARPRRDSSKRAQQAIATVLEEGDGVSSIDNKSESFPDNAENVASLQRPRDCKQSSGAQHFLTVESGSPSAELDDNLRPKTDHSFENQSYMMGNDLLTLSATKRDAQSADNLEGQSQKGKQQSERSASRNTLRSKKRVRLQSAGDNTYYSPDEVDEYNDDKCRHFRSSSRRELSRRFTVDETGSPIVITRTVPDYGMNDGISVNEILDPVPLRQPVAQHPLSGKCSLPGSYRLSTAIPNKQSPISILHKRDINVLSSNNKGIRKSGSLPKTELWQNHSHAGITRFSRILTELMQESMESQPMVDRKMRSSAGKGPIWPATAKEVIVSDDPRSSSASDDAGGEDLTPTPHDTNMSNKTTGWEFRSFKAENRRLWAALSEMLNALMQQLEESEVDLLAVVEQYEVGNKALLTTFRQSREADAKQIHERMEEMEMGYVSSLERELAGLRKQQIASDMEQKSRRELCSPTK